MRVLPSLKLSFYNWSISQPVHQVLKLDIFSQRISGVRNSQQKSLHGLYRESMKTSFQIQKAQASKVKYINVIENIYVYIVN